MRTGQDAFRLMRKETLCHFPDGVAGRVSTAVRLAPLKRPFPEYALAGQQQRPHQLRPAASWFPSLHRGQASPPIRRAGWAGSPRDLASTSLMAGCSSAMAALVL
jgi:hypothetical protein